MSSPLQIVTITLAAAAESDEIDLENRTPVAILTDSSFVGVTLQAKFSEETGGTKKIVHDSAGNEIAKITSASKLQAGNMFAIDISDWLCTNYMTLLSSASETAVIKLFLRDIAN